MAMVGLCGTREAFVGYIVRHIEKRVEDALAVHPVIVLSGPRQVGKSTLLENAKCLKGWRYITLDDADHLEQAKEDPKGLLMEEIPTIIDEIQRCPALLLTVKYYVDRSKRKRKFILSGSGNVSLRKAPRETLAGRAAYLHMTGFSQAEIQAHRGGGLLDAAFLGEEIKSVEAEYQGTLLDTIWRGGLPAVVLASKVKAAREIMAGYIDTYIERDIQDLVKIRYPEHFRRLMEALAQATGRESKQDELSKQCSEERPTVSRHISLLKNTQLLYELRGYSVKGERTYKQAKYFWFDSGTACFMAGLHSPADLKKPELRGNFFENHVFQQILAWASIQTIHPELYYWRMKSEERREVDFVIRHEKIVLPIEVKSASSLDFGDTRSLRDFLKAHPEAKRGLIVYGGGKVQHLASNVVAIPWHLL